MSTKNNTSQPLTNNNETIDLQRLIYKALANWYWFAITIILSLTVAFLVNRYRDPIYKVESSILIRDKSNSGPVGLDNIMEQMSFSGNIAAKNVDNERGILKSYYMARKTIESLNFDISYFGIGRVKESEIYKEEVPFIVIKDTTAKNAEDYRIYVRLMDNNTYHLKIKDNLNVDKTLQFGEDFISEDFNFKIIKNPNFNKAREKTNTSEYYFIINDINVVTNKYKEKLQINTFEKKSSLLTLSIEGNVVEKEVDYLNQITSAYIQMELDEKNKVNRKTIEFIDSQLNIITDSLTAAEEHLESFKKENRTIDLGIEGGLLFEKLEALQKQLSSLLINQKYYQYLLEYLDNKKVEELISPTILGISDPSLSQLVVQLNELSRERNQFKMGASSNNPRIDMIDNEIENSKLLIKENLQTIIKSNELTIENVEKQITKVDIEIRKLPNREKQLINIKRKFTLNDEIYNFLLKKRAESEIAKASNIAENKIIDKARAENYKVISPKKVINYAIGLLLALIIPFIFIVINDFFDNKINEKKDIESRTTIPVIAEIGHNNYNSDLVVLKHPRSSISESFRKLRTSINFSLINKKDEVPVIAFTSTISGEGKSFSSVNTSSVIAASGKKTVILGMDLRKPTLHKFFDTPNTEGISDYLMGQISYNEIIKETQVPNLSLILSGTIPPNPAELIELPQMSDLIQKLKQDFDFIVIDTAPVALVTDALLLSNYIDTFLYVTRQGYTNLSSIEFVNGVKEKHNINFNIVLNGIKQSGYYALNHNYNYKYGGGYYSQNYYQEEEKLPLFIRFFSKFKRK